MTEPSIERLRERVERGIVLYQSDIQLALDEIESLRSQLTAATTERDNWRGRFRRDEWRTEVLDLRQALQRVRAWVDAHPEGAGPWHTDSLEAALGAVDTPPAELIEDENVPEHIAAIVGDFSQWAVDTTPADHEPINPAAASIGANCPGCLGHGRTQMFVICPDCMGAGTFDNDGPESTAFERDMAGGVDTTEPPETI